MRGFILGLGLFAGMLSFVEAHADITIGVNLSTTGPAASLGIPEKNALVFAPKTIAGEKVNFVVYDDASDTTSAVQNVKRLVSENKVDLILGPTTTPTALAVADIAAQAKTPMLAVAASSAIVSPVDAKRRWIFKVTANDDVYAAAMPHAALVERGYKGKIYQTGGAANADFLKVGGKAVEGAFMPASPVLVAEQLPNGYPIKNEALKFSKAYEGKFGPRSTFSSHIWDALKVVEAAVPRALKAGKPGTLQFREALRSAIEETKGLKGAGAVFTLSGNDHSGVNQLGIAMISVEKGKWKLVQHSEYK